MFNNRYTSQLLSRCSQMLGNEEMGEDEGSWETARGTESYILVPPVLSFVTGLEPSPFFSWSLFLVQLGAPPFHLR